MKIDEACINHNALRLIRNLMETVYDMIGPDDETDHCRVATLGEINGILSMADAMKEVLEA